MNLFLRRYILVLLVVLWGTCGSYAQWQPASGGKAKSLNVWVSEDGKSSTLTLVYRHDGKFIASDNTAALEYIKSVVDKNRKAIESKEFKIWVDSYVSKDEMPGYLCRQEALSLSNIFKSHAITNWGLSEVDFTTQNFSGMYDNAQGVTVVTLGENYPYEYIGARQVLNLSDMLSSEPNKSGDDLPVERVVVRQTLDGREVGVVAQTEPVIKKSEVDVADTAMLSKLLTEIESRQANRQGDDNKFYNVSVDRNSGLGVDKPLPKDDNYELLYPQRLQIGDSGSPALASSGMKSGSQNRYFTLNRFLTPMGVVPSNPYGLSFGGGGTLSASSMYGVNVPGLMNVREPISQFKGESEPRPRVDDGRTPESSLFKIMPPSYNAPLGAYSGSMIGSTQRPISPINAGSPQVLTYNMSGPSISQIAQPQATPPSIMAGIDMNNQIFTPIRDSRIKQDRSEKVTGSKIRVGGKSMPSIEVGPDGKIVLDATSIGYTLNKGALARDQREAQSYDAGTKRAERELANQRKSDMARGIVADKGRFPIMGVGVNALAALTTTVSGQLDFYFHNHLSFGVEGAYNKWNVMGDKYRTGIWMGSAEFRYWFGKSKKFTGFYLGAYGSMGDFNFRFASTEGTQSSFYSVGLTAGYVLRLGKESNFYVDFGLGGGFVHDSGVDYTFSNGYNIFKQSFIRTGIAPTKAKVTFMYRIFNGPKGGLY